MAVYKLNSSKKRSKNPNVKKITGFSLIGAASVIFLFLTGIVPLMQEFFLGVFGVFGYPLSLSMIVIGLALVNNRRYVMSKKYTICLILSVVFLLCILQLAVVGGKQGNFWEYLSLNYHKNDGLTAGGFLIGLITSTFLYITTSYAGSFIIFAIGFIICVAILVDDLRHMRTQKEENEPVALQIKDKATPRQQVSESQIAPQQKEEINVVLNGNLKEEEEAQAKKPLTAREILGLDKKRNKAYEEVVVPEKPKEKEKPMSLKEYILTPPEINIDEYFKDFNKTKEVPTVGEVSENISELKREEPIQNEAVRPDEFEVEKQPAVVRPLPEIKSEELVEQADDILKSAIEEEKIENPELYQNVSPEQNVIDRLPDRNNSGTFERPNGRGLETIKFGGRDDRPLTQEDMDARDEFQRDRGRFGIRNGSLARTQQPIPEEEPEEPVVPYVYEKPPIDFITTKSVDLSTLNEDVAQKRVALENVLETFGVPAKVQSVVVGPAVTRYELEMPSGVSVQKIKTHADDIALSLATDGAIRIEAPIPGKSMVGIEVPNASIATISLKDVLMSKEFQTASSPLTFALGKDITGNIICCNMQKLTHLLVAGSTGSGKSVCLNSIILSIIYKASPEDVKILLIDPKRVEFANYEALPHLIMPKIVCETQKAINALTWAVNEMERRFDVLGMARVKNIDEFNQTPDVLSGKIKKMPFLVVIVDELADLMMTGKKEVEEKVCRLAQKARAAGIHLILATQRPSVDVITGLIKSNFPSRISFAVTSAVDSMTILARIGAEKLLGKGDMFYFPNGAKEPSRVQGCFISTNEINNIVDYVRDNNEQIYDKDIEDAINNPNKNSGPEGVYNEEMDPYLPLALKAAIECKQASTTMIRRKFAVGFSRAGRIIDQMEKAGYISSADGPKGRTVYLTMEEFKDIFGDQYD